MRYLLVFGACVGLTIWLRESCPARWARPDLTAPVERLIANVQAYVRRHPAEAHARYILGRLHSLAFAKEASEVSLYSNREDGEGLPEFPAFQPLRVEPERKQATAAALRHFRESVQNYREAIRLASGRIQDLQNRLGLYYLGYAWMLEQGHRLGRLAGPPPGGRPAWREQALQAYREAFRYGEHQERANPPLHGVHVIAQEALEGIERLQQGRALTDAEKREMARMRNVVREILAQPRPITPVIFPLMAEQDLERLLVGKSVRFDLAGDGIPRQWEWVGPNTGILVWDPEKTGRIVSGRQLFGSVTWWMFWENGYQPLAALDDNRDGFLSDRELEGIAVWRDANTDGVAGPGEVIPARKAGIRRIATRASGSRGGTLWHPAGIVLQDGAVRPTFDWMPVGKPVIAR